MNPLTNKPFYVGIGNDKRCKIKHRANKTHKKLVDSFPNRKFNRKILYSNISLERACHLERQIIKRCGRLLDGSGYLANVHKGGILDFLEKDQREKEDPSWTCYRKGKTFKELFGDDYINPRVGKKYTDYNPNFVNSAAKQFKLVVNDVDVFVFTSEKEFLTTTKLHKRVLYKLRKCLNYSIKRRQHNTLHNFQAGDKLTYIPLTLDEYLKER
jgi:hypothetical protein